MHYTNAVVKLTLLFPFMNFELCILQNEVERINLERQHQGISVLNVQFTLSDKTMFYMYVFDE